MKQDSVDELIHRWHLERPDLDPWPSGIAGRIFRLTVRLRKHAEEWLGILGLTWETFEILMALRRSGPPYEMKPTALYKATLLTSGAMTNRLDRAEATGLIVRTADPVDRRGVVIRLTPAGMKMADAAASRYYEESSALMGHLDKMQRKDLSDLLRVLLSELEDDVKQSPQERSHSGEGKRN